MSDIEEEYEFDEEFVEEQVFSDGDKTLNERLTATVHEPSMTGSFKNGGDDTPLQFDLSMTQQPPIVMENNND